MKNIFRLAIYLILAFWPTIGLANPKNQEQLVGDWVAVKGGIAEQIAFSTEPTSAAGEQGRVFRSYLHERLLEKGVWVVDEKNRLRVVLDGGVGYTFTSFQLKNNLLTLEEGKVRHVYKRILPVKQ